MHILLILLIYYLLLGIKLVGDQRLTPITPCIYFKRGHYELLRILTM